MKDNIKLEHAQRREFEEGMYYADCPFCGFRCVYTEIVHPSGMSRYNIHSKCTHYLYPEGIDDIGLSPRFWSRI